MLKPDHQKRVKGGLRPFSSAPCRVKGQRPLWGLGQRPNGCSCDQLCKSTQSCPTSAEQRSAFSAALVTLRSRRSAPKLLYPLLAHCRAKWARPHSRSTAPCPCFPPPNGYPTQKDTRKPAAQNRWLFQSPEIFTSSAPPDESAGTSARSPQTRTSWGAVHAARDSAPIGRSKAECSAPATIG